MFISNKVSFLRSTIGWGTVWHNIIHETPLLEDFIQAQKYIVYIFKMSVHNLRRLVWEMLY
jgi:hypothetical protein